MIINLLQNYPTFLTESLDRYDFQCIKIPFFLKISHKNGIFGHSAAVWELLFWGFFGKFPFLLDCAKI